MQGNLDSVLDFLLSVTFLKRVIIDRFSVWDLLVPRSFLIWLPSTNYCWKVEGTGRLLPAHKSMPNIFGSPDRRSLNGSMDAPRSNESLSTKLPGHQVQHHLACPTLQKTTTVRWTWLRRAGFFHWDQVHRHTSLLWPIYLVNLWIANYCLDRLWKSQISFFLVWPNWKQKMHLLTRNHGRKSMEWARLLRQQ